MKPLEGIKVVDLTSYLAAPTTGRVLAEWGADVVKVESFGGDPARRQAGVFNMPMACLLYTYPSPRDRSLSRIPSSA